MSKLFKRLKAKAEREVAKRHCEKDEEDRLIINMTVKDDSDFLSVFSESEKPVISADVAEFIENSTYAAKPLQQFTLKIHSTCIDEQEQRDYADAIKEYYAERYTANEKELKKNRSIIFLLTLVGICILAFALRIENLIFAETIDIVAWVILWEAADIGVLRSRDLRLRRKRYLSYISMKVEYSNE